MIGSGGPLFTANIGPTPEHFWLTNLVRVAPGIINLHETRPILAVKSGPPEPIIA